MKPFEELSRLGRIRRMRQLAQVALNAYGLSDVRFKLLRQAGNTLFRVNEVDPVPTTKAELYTQGQYLLRIHLPRYQTTEAIVDTGLHPWDTGGTQLLALPVGKGTSNHKRCPASSLPSPGATDGQVAWLCRALAFPPGSHKAEIRLGRAVQRCGWSLHIGKGNLVTAAARIRRAL